MNAVFSLLFFFSIFSVVDFWRDALGRSIADGIPMHCRVKKV